jgi:hypothetical protein
MRRFHLAIACLLAYGLAGCAVAGSVSTASVTADGQEITVRSSQWEGGVACGLEPGEPACTASESRFP